MLPPICTPACLAARPQTPLKERLEEERKEYEAAVAAGPAIPAGREADLNMRILLVHGDEQVGAGEVQAKMAARPRLQGQQALGQSGGVTGSRGLAPPLA